MRVTAVPSDTDLRLPGDDTPIAEAARLYVEAGLPPIAIWGLRADGSCQCGRSDCTKAAGKHPVDRAWQRNATLDPEAVRDRFSEHEGNIGVFLALNHLVLLDADGAAGRDTLAEWAPPPTLTQRSGRADGGTHHIYQLAPHQDGKAITDRRVAPGVDVKVRGQFVAAPSLHASGNRYRWIDPRPVATLPDDLYARLVKPKPAPTFVPNPVDDPGKLYDRARAYLARVPPAVSGAGGHTATINAVRAIMGWVHRGLSESQGWSLLLEYNARCQPPWNDHDIAHKWNERTKLTHIPTIEDRPRLSLVRPPHRHDPETGEIAHDSSPPTAPSPSSPSPTPVDWRSELLWTESKQGRPKLVNHVDNVVRILQLDPRWRGRIRFDAFRSRISIATDAPWDDYHRPVRSLDYWTDADAVRLSAWMRRNFHNYAFDPSVSDCERAALIAARTHDYNPVRDYLAALEWDGAPRLAHWLTTYLGADDDEYDTFVGTAWLISAVARVFDPGCKVDTVPILEGPQGLRKSTALRVLAGPAFFNDTPIDLDSKDAYTAIQGCWFVELAELESLMRASSSRAKAFFSSPVDRFRRAYAKHETEEQRQCIFVGTVNHGEYLTDPTGGRRFWPIVCARIDLDALSRERDQLWAEAVAEYRDGRAWYPETEADTAALTERQESKTEADSWESLIAGYLGRGQTEVTTGDILSGALSLEPRDWTRQNQTRVGIVLGKLNWKRRQIRVGDKRHRVYERPTP